LTTVTGIGRNLWGQPIPNVRPLTRVTLLSAPVQKLNLPANKRTDPDGEQHEIH
jgi:hypothetical protein